MRKTLQVFNFSIQNASDDSVDIHIDGDIVDASTQELMKAWWGDETSVSFKSFRNSVTSSGAKKFNVYINSGGGHVGDAMAIHDLLVEMQNDGKIVNTIGRGIIASAATYILMAGKNSEMSKNSWFMIHNVAGGVYGEVNYIENYAKTLRKFNDSTRDFYANATGMRKEDVTKMMDNETWMTADEAKNKGFVKNVTGDVSFTNAIPRENWNFSNTAVLNSYNSNVPTREVSLAANLQNQFDDMKKFFTDIVNSIKVIKPAEGATQADFANQIAEALTTPFEGLADEIEKQINEKVDPAVTNAVAAAVKPLNQEIADLKKKNGELEKEIENKLGGETKPDPKDEGVKPIGNFKKG